MYTLFYLYFLLRRLRNWSIMGAFKHVLPFKPQKMCMSSIRGRLAKLKKSGSSLHCESLDIGTWHKLPFWVKIACSSLNTYIAISIRVVVLAELCSLLYIYVLLLTIYSTPVLPVAPQSPSVFHLWAPVGIGGDIKANQSVLWFHLQVSYSVHECCGVPHCVCGCFQVGVWGCLLTPWQL